MGQPLTLPGNLKSPTLSIHHRDKCVTESVCLGTDFTSTWISCRVVPLLPSRYLKYQCAACRLIVRPRRGCLLCCCWESYDLCWGASAQDPGARMLSAEWAKRGWAAWVVGACLYRPLYGPVTASSVCRWRGRFIWGVCCSRRIGWVVLSAKAPPLLPTTLTSTGAWRASSLWRITPFIHPANIRSGCVSWVPVEILSPGSLRNTLSD